jgi:hypothetical protein
MNKPRIAQLLMPLAAACSLTFCAYDMPVDEVEVGVSSNALTDCDGVAVMLTDFVEHPGGYIVCIGGSGGMQPERPLEQPFEPKRREPQERPPEEPTPQQEEPGGIYCGDICQALIPVCQSECADDNQICREQCGRHDSGCTCNIPPSTPPTEVYEPEPEPQPEPSHASEDNGYRPAETLMP